MGPSLLQSLSFLFTSPTSILPTFSADYKCLQEHLAASITVAAVYIVIILPTRMLSNNDNPGAAINPIGREEYCGLRGEPSKIALNVLPVTELSQPDGIIGSAIV